MHLTSRKTLVACLAAVLALSTAAFADPPAQVGRLNMVEGSVSLRAGDEDEWSTATLNYPLTAGDSLWVDGLSRAEVHLATAVIRLGPDTELTFLDLDDQSVQLALLRGTASVRLRGIEADESFEVDTPTMSVVLPVEASIRVDAADDGGSRTVVREGRVEVVVDGLTYPVRAGQAASAAAFGPLSVEIRRAPATDEWDRWCAERDSREERVAATRYVPRVMIGYEDLDWYGSWSETSDYGVIWVPSSVPAGWAPYRNGRWAWVKPWGWTWIDEAPWGFAPFHYGRWAHHRGRWVWVPGSISYRPVYAPALVVFIEAGPGGLRVHGSVGWFPLGPREAYYPPYDASPQYIQKVNIMHVRVDGGRKDELSHLRYVNKGRPHAVTVVPGDSFRHSRKVDESRIEVSEKEIAGFSAGGAKAPAAPDRQGGLEPRGGQGSASKPPSREKPQTVVVKKAPQGGRKDQQSTGWVQQPGPRSLKEKAPTVKEKPAPGPRETEPRLEPSRTEPQLKPAPQKQPQKEPQLKPAPQKQPQKDPQVQQGSGKKDPRPEKKMQKVRKKKLVNGQWIWVEEWEPVEEEKD